MMLKASFSGAGYISHYHARGLKTCQDVQLISVTSATRPKADAFLKEHELKGSVYTDFEQMINESECDLVILSIPNKFHYPQTMYALESGKHVFVEKPMACSVQESEEMLNLAQKKNLILMVGHMWRFDAEANYLSKQIANGKIGRPFKATGYGIHVNWGPEGWFVKKDLAWGGALADMGIHAIDTVRYLIGDPMPRNVFAKVGNNIKPMEVDDSAIVMIEWDNDVVSVIESGWWHPHMQGPEAAARIYGTTGYASLYPTYITVNGKEGTGADTCQRISESFPERSQHCPQQMYSRQMQEFVQAICDNRTPIASGETGLINMKIVTAAYNSSQTGECQNLQF